MKKRRISWVAVYAFLLIIFTGYVLLDTFVIARVYTEVEGPKVEEPKVEEPEAEEPEVKEPETEEPETEEPETEEPVKAAPVITENSYKDNNISIVLTEYREYDTTIYVAEVKISSEEYIKTALAENAYGKNVTEKTSEMAERVEAILAINGDYYGAREEGYVIRNGVLYRDVAAEDTEALVIYKDGSLGIVQESAVSAQELLENGAWNVLSFGPGLVIDGEIAVTKDEEVGKAMADNPRTAIGLLEDLHYVFVVSDGRTKKSEGLTLHELADFMLRLGVTTAYNLDGGGSSTMYFNGEVINNPTTSGRSIKERSVSDIVYIGY